MLRNVFVSINTLKNRDNKISNIIETYIKNDIKFIELGSTNCYEPDIMNCVFNLKKESNVNFAIHNYFPPAIKPIIINLASDSEAIRSDSIQFIKNCIDLSNKLNCGVYSFHAGFLVDPDNDFKYSNSKITEYNKAFDYFCDSILILNRYAKERGIKLAIENNQASYKVKDYVMFYGSADFIRLFEKVADDNIGVHLDVGHLKVASKTFGFDPVSFLMQFKDRIYSMHLHDNDGMDDTHNSFTSESWFIDRLKYITKSALLTIESHNQDIQQIKEMIKLIQNI